ncbi:TetR/AcrR family transcriptional regulator [Streptomyces sp. NPDC006739]|uniref:TetR/AcrR family transcriptional regulator n=1 Tax=Streptomyces sp. NPDC006739 TaxID=3364763 RepID=UPI0036B4F3A6
MPAPHPSTGQVDRRDRAALLGAARRHFLMHGVGTSLEAVAKEAGVGPGTLYRHFPTREALLAAVLQTRSEELVARQADIAPASVTPSEALRQWLRALEEYFSAFGGLPEPLMAAARAQEADTPLTLPRPSVKGHDLFLAAIAVAWISGTGAADEE